MTFKDILLEKVAKNEIETALKNPNIMIGAEFEFTIPPFLERYEKEVEMFERLQDMEEEQLKYDEALDAWLAIPNNKEPLPNLPEWAVEQGFELGEEVPPPDELFPELTQVTYEKMFKRLVKHFINLETLPFKNMIVSGNHNTKSTTKWVIKPDGSLGLSGVEIVSPVLPLREFLQVTPKMFEWMNNMNVEVGEDCGFHISMSLKNIHNLGEALDITKLSLFLDEGYIYYFFATREFNTYARSAHDSISRTLINKNSPKLAEKLIDTTSMKKKYPADHYMAINIEHLMTKNEYIEFRYIGATNYHRKWDRIRTIIAHYVYDLSLACDPTWKKKEYEHKLARLLNKIQLFTVVTEMTKMKLDTDADRSDPEFRKNWKSLWESWKALYQYKEAVDRDIENEHGRKGFLRLCAMLDIKENDLIWNFSKDRILR